MVYAYAINNFSFLATQYAIPNRVTSPWSEYSCEPLFSSKGRYFRRRQWRGLADARVDALRKSYLRAVYLIYIQGDQVDRQSMNGYVIQVSNDPFQLPPIPLFIQIPVILSLLTVVLTPPIGQRLSSPYPISRLMCPHSESNPGQRHGPTCGQPSTVLLEEARPRQGKSYHRHLPDSIDMSNQALFCK